MTNIIRAEAQDASSAGPSARLWGRRAQPCTGQVWTNPREGFGFFDDFLTFGASGTGYTIVEADAGNIGLIATEVGGVVRMTSGGTDNGEISLMGSINEGVMGKISPGARCWYETRVRVSSITDGTPCWAVGMCSEGGCGANFLVDDTGLMSDIDFVGFSVVAADGDAPTLIYRTNSGSIVTVDATPDHGAIAAATWVKLGFAFDGESTITYYIDGTAESETAEYDDSGFPDGEEMSVCAGIKTSAASSFTLDIDWIAFAMER